MAWHARVRSLLRNLLHRGRVERDLDDELQATLDLLIDEKVAGGQSVEQAHRSALIDLRIEPIKERVRDVRTGATMETLIQDLRYASRHVRRSPGFATAAVLTLALGIGANTAMFSMLHALTNTPLAIGDPAGLLAIAPRTARGLDRSTPVDAVAHLQDGPLQPLCGYLGGVVLSISANGTPVQTSTTFITAECLEVFQIQPVMGRSFTREEAPISTRGARVALISHRFWSNVFGADPDVLGKTIQVNGVEVTIIGVLPRGFVGLEVDNGVDVFTPFDAVLPATAARRQLAGFLLGRLRPGVAFEQAEAELRSRWPAILDAVLPATLPPSELANFRDSIVRLEPMRVGRSTLRERYVQPLTLIYGLTGLLLLLACVNLGGLLLARLTARSSELAVRLALGGSRWRIAQQMLIESVVLSLAGALLAVPLAYVAVSTLASFIPPVNVPYTMTLTPDLRVLAATGLVGVVVGVAMSALPIWMALRRRSGGHFTWDRTIAGSANKWGRGLLVTQVALSAVLLVAAALLTRSLYELRHADLGVRTSGVTYVRMIPLPASTPNRGDKTVYFQQLMERVSALPGVRSAAFARVFPRGGNLATVPITFAGEGYETLTTFSDYVSATFFDTMGIPLVAGRPFAPRDDVSKGPEVIVSQSLALALSPDGDVIGRRIRFGSIPADQDRLIVGIVANATQGNPRDSAPRVVYRPLQLSPDSSTSGNLLIASDHAPIAAGVRDVLRELGRDYAQEIISVDEVIVRAPATERMSATVAAAVGVLALVLALIGAHGVLAYSVVRRRREIGIRVALGATPSSVARGIIREGLVLTAAGAVLGVTLAALGARSLQTLMFGISELDLSTYAAVTAFFLVLGAAAGVLPARRAAAVDPVHALRAE